MATAKEREEFIGMFCAQYPKRPAYETVAAALKSRETIERKFWERRDTVTA